ncbi:MAG: aerial mycelium formation protein [Nitriliruptorales bacterium]
MDPRLTGRRRLDRILAPTYLDDLPGRSTAEIRAMRDECEEEESGVSFARRILQGKLDILRAEALRRQESDTNGGLQSLLDALPQILSDEVPSRLLRPRVPRSLIPSSVEHRRREVERLVEDHTLAMLEDRSTEELSQMVHLLALKERELSELRRQLFDRIDALQEELARRYQLGEASVKEVLPGQA